MATYNLFKFGIKPLPENELYARISAGSAIVLVIDESSDNALKRALSHVENAKWQVGKIEVFPATKEPSQSEDPYFKRMQRTAEALGIGCIYHYRVGGGEIFN